MVREASHTPRDKTVQTQVLGLTARHTVLFPQEVQIAVFCAGHRPRQDSLRARCLTIHQEANDEHEDSAGHDDQTATRHRQEELQASH
jgi:hypothetical protein